MVAAIRASGASQAYEANSPLEIVLSNVNDVKMFKSASVLCFAISMKLLNKTHTITVHTLQNKYSLNTNVL
jgi:hypothetical protein